jgi:hypothetical protein
VFVTFQDNKFIFKKIRSCHRYNLVMTMAWEVGVQNRPWVLGTLIYTDVKLVEGGSRVEQVLNTHTSLSQSQLNFLFALCNSVAKKVLGT